MKRVKNYTNVITQLTHGLTFATDAEVNGRIVEKYKNYVFIYDANVDQQDAMKAVIHDWSDYTNKLYQTTLFEYDPIENYDRKESGLDTRTDNLNHTKSDTTSATASATGSATGTQSTNDLTTTHKDAGYGSGSDTTITSSDSQNGSVGTNSSSTNNSTSSGSLESSAADTGTVTNEHELRVHGNNGVMSTQDMIAKEREIIIDVLDWYIAKFAECFDLCGILHYSYNWDVEEVPEDADTEI